MTADSLAVARDECIVLGKFLFESCKGHPLHTLQLLRALHANKAIEVSMSTTGRLAFDETLATKVLNEAGGDALQLVSELIRCLPARTQKWLSTAAFLGSEFEGKLVELASGGKLTGKDCAPDTIQAGLIRTNPRDDDRFRFIHDVVQQASYELVDKDKHARFHFDIGMNLWSSLKQKTLDTEDAITAASHLQYGLDFIHGEEEKVAAAELLLRAAKRANMASSFSTALTFLRSARALLPPRNQWRDYYQLSLDIHVCAAETEYLVGNYDDSDRECDGLIKNCRSELDMIPAYTTKIFSLGIRARIQEALQLGLEVLSRLGEPVPRNPGLLQVLLAFRKTDGLLRNMSRGDILGLPRMTDPTKLSTMQILHVIFTYAYTQASTFRAMVSCKMIQITLQHGLSACSSVGFAFHAVVLQASFERIAESYRYGQIALQLLDDFGVNEYIARVYVYIHGVVNTAVRPVNESECFSRLEHAYRCGMVTGDHEFGYFALHILNSIKMYQGTPVHLVYDEALQVLQTMLSARQHVAALLHVAFLHSVAGIAGVVPPITVIDGSTMTREVLIENAVKENDSTMLVVVYGNWAAQQFWNGDYQSAMHHLQKARRSGMQGVLFHFRCSLVFFEGMANLILLSESRQCGLGWRYKRRGHRALLFLRKHARVAPENLFHQVLLLEAMMAGIGGHWQLSMSKYNLATERARERGLLAEEALANELVARAIIRRNQGHLNQEAVNLFGRARELYYQWGAVKKVGEMEPMTQTSFH